MLVELVFDVVLTPGSTGNRPLHEFSRDHPDFRRRIQEVRYTRDAAWLVILVEGGPATMKAYDRAFRRRVGYPVAESRRLASGPGFRLVYERHRAPKPGEADTVWSIASRTLGTDARIVAVTEGGRSRITVQHGSRRRLRAYFDAVAADDPANETRLVRIGPAGAPETSELAPQDVALLDAAWRRGYFEVPRRVTLRDLAREVGVPFTTVGYRLRRLEADAVRALLVAAGSARGDAGRKRRA